METSKPTVGAPRAPTSVPPLHSMLLDADASAPLVQALQPQQLMTIRAADTDGHRSSAHVLLERKYADSGYSTSFTHEAPAPSRFTLLAEVEDVVLGTLTIGFDGPEGLLVDQCFGDEAGRLRDQGAVLCEFVKFAVDSIAHSKRVLASLFHTAFLYAYHVRDCNRIMIEVNPRHVRFYKTMLGFEVLAEERINPRVNAPGVLMSIDLHYGARRIGEAHQEQGESRERSMYRYFFSPAETVGIVNRLLTANGRASL